MYSTLLVRCTVGANTVHIRKKLFFALVQNVYIIEMNIITITIIIIKSKNYAQLSREAFYSRNFGLMIGKIRFRFFTACESRFSITIAPRRVSH